MSNLSPDHRLTLRGPTLLFGPLAIVLLFVVALAFATFASVGFARLDPLAAHGLITPTAIGLALTVIGVAPRLRRGQIASRLDLIRRAAVAFAIAGFVWPLSFGLAVLFQGDAHTALSSLGPVAIGALIGAVAGALGAATAASACCTDT